MVKEVLVEISARHVHVSEEHLEILFGKGYKLTPKKDLSQPGYFVSSIGINKSIVMNYVKWQGAQDSDQLRMEL